MKTLGKFLVTHSHIDQSNLQPRQRYYNYSQGFSMVEVMIATFLIAITLVPTIDSLATAMLGSAIHAEQARNRARLSGKMEETLAQPFSELLQHADNAGSSTVIIDAYSDDITTSQRRLVYLSRYDGDNADGDNNGFTGTDNNLLWLQVKIEGSPAQLETLTAGVSL